MSARFGLRPGYSAAAYRRMAASKAVEARQLALRITQLVELHRQLAEESACLLAMAQITKRMETVR